MANKKYTDAMIEAEADKIFTKLNPQFKRMDGTFPRAYSPGATPKYNREYDRVFNQVKNVRKSMNK
jgi:hypothetical protein